MQGRRAWGSYYSWDDVRLRVPRPPAAARPGTITVQGNLAFQSGALYMVQDHEILDRIDTHTRQAWLWTQSRH
jgi:hypothetical protein